MSFEAQIGDVICTAGRGAKCRYKRNASFMRGLVKGQTCGYMNQSLEAIEAIQKVCKFAGGKVS